MKIHLLLAVALLLLLFSAMGALAETRIFDLSHRRAADVAEAVRTALGNEAKVTAVDHSLVVNAAPHQLAAAVELIRHLDHPPRMLRIYIAQEREQTGQGANFDAAGRVSIGSSTVVIGRPDIQSRGGASILMGDDDRLRVGVASSSRREVRNVEQFIVTLEGNPARISVGKRIPFTERWLMLARRHAHVIESIHYESVDTGFEVQPELAGGQVLLSIHPYMAFQDPRRPREIRFQELATRVNIPLGQWFDLAGTMAGHDEVSREILGAGRQSGSERGSVRVRVELQPE